MGLKPLPSNSRHRNTEGTRVKFYFSCRSALALRASCPKPGLKPWVFSDLQTLEGACFDKPCRAVGAHIWGRPAGVSSASQERRHQLQPMAPREAPDRQRHGQEGGHRVVIPALITQTPSAVGDSGEC